MGRCGVSLMHKYPAIHFLRSLCIQVSWILLGRCRRATCRQSTSDTAAGRPQPRKAEPREICAPAKGHALNPVMFVSSLPTTLMSDGFSFTLQGQQQTQEESQGASKPLQCSAFTAQSNRLTSADRAKLLANARHQFVLCLHCTTVRGW